MALLGKRMPRRLTATKRNRVIIRLGKTAFSFIPVNIKKVG
jgi:hypothetical protein